MTSRLDLKGLSDIEDSHSHHFSFFFFGSLFVSALSVCSSFFRSFIILDSASPQWIPRDFTPFRFPESYFTEHRLIY